MTKIIYGINPVLSALENNIKIHEVFLVEKKFENVVNELKNKNIKINSLSNFNFDKYDIPKDINVQGIIAIITPKSLLSVNELINKAKKEEENPILVLLDKITDPQNLGAIIRNVSAFAINGLIIGEHNQAMINSTVHKASAGNVFNINIAKTKSLSNTIKLLKENDF
jgi:23S rRNA (guanosine2251-2'-O)-methyltransferase